ncbi:MAG: alanine racemase [Gammaproteobacteria bacterium]
MTTVPEPAWWLARREELLAALAARDCAYAYDLATVSRQARRLLALRSLARVYYAVKANPHPAIIAALADAGLGFECVSLAELERVTDAAAGIARERLLFTPNFAPRAEYREALEQGIRVTVDNAWVLHAWAPLFAGQQIFVRVDTELAHGHHEKVRTAGAYSKFGVPPAELAELAALADAAGARVAGLHAHGGSGSFDPAHWTGAAHALAAAVPRFPSVRVLNLGGGLGVPESGAQAPLDLAAFDAALAAFGAAHPGFELWLEPGRFLVAEAGVLLARVTQVKGKGARRYVGVATGMNSLLRPALYGSRHEIVNLTRLGEPPAGPCTVVGPICESGDVLGEHCMLPACEEGDVLLIAVAGAYGHSMASHYNLRAPAEELILQR